MLEEDNLIERVVSPVPSMCGSLQSWAMVFQKRSDVIDRVFGSVVESFAIELVQVADKLRELDGMVQREQAENACLRAELDNVTHSMHDGWVRLPLDADVSVVMVEDGPRCRHYHAPTVEDVLREFAHVGIRIAAKHGIEAGEIDFYADEEAIAEYAAKLRLADDVE